MMPAGWCWRRREADWPRRTRAARSPAGGFADDHPRAGFDAVLLQVPHQLGVFFGFFGDPLDGEVVARVGLVQRELVGGQAPQARDGVPVRTRGRIAERLEQA